jgi:hypothetical protein
MIPRKDRGSARTLAENLLVTDVVNAHGVVLLQTVWAITPDILAGRRRTDVERIADQAQLIGRLGELVAKMFEPVSLAAAA